jgi:large subunit ribosomal protein L35
MPKMKTNKSLKSRFKVTATGKLLRGRPGRRHKLEKMSSKSKRHLATKATVSEELVKKFRIMMGV